MKEKNKSFATSLKRELYNARVTQRELAAKIGITESTVSLWVKGKNVPRMDKIDSICKALGCTRAELLDYRPVDYGIEELFGKLTDEGKAKAIDYLNDLVRIYGR